MASKTKLFIIFSAISVLHFDFSLAQNAVNAAYWFARSEFPVSDIDSTLFTHLFCGFANLNPQSKKVTISSSDTASFSQFTKTVQLKNPAVKTILSIGGGDANKSDYASMASELTSRKDSIDSSIKLARSNGFHGLDLDWEYPQQDSDMKNLGSLLEDWRAAVDSEAKDSGMPPLILTAAVSYKPIVDGLKYPIESVSRSLDWINIMAYDFYAPSRSKFTNSHAALYDPSGQVSGSQGIEDWKLAGVAAKKLVLGIPFYGYAWQLVDPNNHGLLAPASGPVTPPDDGSIGYNNIKEFISKSMATTVYNATIVSNYCYAGTTWIGYDDTESVSTKVSYAKQELLGYFGWHVGVDEKWALSQQAKQAWGSVGFVVSR